MPTDTTHSARRLTGAIFLGIAGVLLVGLVAHFSEIAAIIVVIVVALILGLALIGKVSSGEDQ